MKTLHLLLLPLLAVEIVHGLLLSTRVSAELIADHPATPVASNGQNLISNGNFEEGTEGWELIAFQKKGTMAIDTKELHNGKPTLRIENAEGDHAFVRQILKGKPHTLYRLSGWIKTKDVEAVKGGIDGAVLMVGMTLNMTFSIQNTTPWTRVSTDFLTGDKEELRVGASLGTYARPVTGVAWFSDLSLVELGDSPAPRRRTLEPSTEPSYVAVPDRAKTFVDPVEMLLKSAPASAVRRLQEDPTAQDATTEINRYFAEYALNKSIVLHTAVEAAEPHPDIRNAFRIRAASAPLQWEGGSMKRLSWLYFQSPDGATANSVKLGSDITVVGWIRRCEVVSTQDGLRLNFDLQYTRIEDASKPLP